MTNETSQTRKPEYRIYHVVGQGDKAIWTPIGAAWEHRDQLGFAVRLDLVPLTGRIVMRVIGETTETNGGQP
ncbi:hypothetical protein FPZ54_06655 [Sphingomonas suaedae]|uniref:Uncharacterized protein n=1 Tax=Sphingomonas suaedae TaxID=2599297 RepID=A0A518RE67_9SPHN|nr:hypothetical protein [Sphingomonas suaedae]QDX25729.1 hypothetical protein FPZ54_06655 [Sphingomonas suaedae]